MERRIHSGIAGFRLTRTDSLSRGQVSWGPGRSRNLLLSSTFYRCQLVAEPAGGPELPARLNVPKVPVRGIHARLKGTESVILTLLAARQTLGSGPGG